MGLFYNLGKSIFGGANAGVALYVVLQMIFASFIFSVLATYLYKKNIPNVIAYLTVVYFAVSPLHATYSITVWKDIVYGLLMVLIVLNILVFIDNPDSKKHLVYFMILALLSLFFRNNGIYVLIVFIPFMIVYLIINHRQVKGLIVSLGLIILPYFIVSGPVFKLLKVGEAPITEALSIPLNQMARVAYLDGNIDNKEKDYLDKLMDISLVKTSYQQTLADPVKNLTNKEVIDKDRLRFMAVYFTLMPKNLFTYIDSYLYETNGYWSVALVDIPLVGSMEYEPVSSLYNIYHHSLLPHFMDRFFDMTKDFGMPFLQFFYSSGLMFYLLVVSFIISFYKKKNKYWLAYIPLLAVWLTIMMATPIYASARYVYPLFICLPLYLAIPLFKD